MGETLAELDARLEQLAREQAHAVEHRNWSRDAELSAAIAKLRSRRERLTHRPILFSGPMVRAILEGRKSQTRRVVKPQPVMERIESFGPSWAWRKDAKHWFSGVTEEQLRAPYGMVASCPSPFQPGDRLWVRETFAACRHGAEHRQCIEYRADDVYGPCAEEIGDAPKWKPSIYMPRWASRLTLEVTDVRVERLQDITEAGALAEGVTSSAPTFEADGSEFGDARTAFHFLWDGINGKRAPWSTNPWVWVVSFKRLET